MDWTINATELVALLRATVWLSMIAAFMWIVRNSLMTSWRNVKEHERLAAEWRELALDGIRLSEDSMKKTFDLGADYQKLKIVSSGFIETGSLKSSADLDSVFGFNTVKPELAVKVQNDMQKQIDSMLFSIQPLVDATKNFGVTAAEAGNAMKKLGETIGGAQVFEVNETEAFSAGFNHEAASNPVPKIVKVKKPPKYSQSEPAIIVPQQRRVKLPDENDA